MENGKRIIEQIVRITTDGEETRAEVIGELVRCKDCKHYRDSFPYDICEAFAPVLVPDEYDFCSYGERKERSEDVGKSDTDDNR